MLCLHGSIWELRCADGCDGGRAARRDLEAPLASLPPRCRHCNGFERPGVVWFGESLDAAVLGRAADAAATCDVFLTIGTSAVVYPAAGLVVEAKRHGATTIEVNPDETPLAPYLDFAVRHPAESFLPLVEVALGIAAWRGRAVSGSTSTSAPTPAIRKAATQRPRRRALATGSTALLSAGPRRRANCY